MKTNKLRLAIIGIGNGRGFQLINVIAQIPALDVTAVCDLYEDRAMKGANLVYELKGEKPFMATDYKTVLDRADVDAVIITTSWEDHIEIAIASVLKGKITGLDVGGAYSINDCWELVRAVERTKTPFMFLENCCFDRSELMVTNMVRKGLLGQIVHCSGAYAHDLREEIITGIEKRHYRLRNYLSRNCDNYPTHELGPLSKILNINRGNRMLSVVSVATGSFGMKEYALSKNRADLKDFAQGDIITTVIKCSGGQTIFIKLDTVLPGFYDRAITVRGTKGLYNQTLNAVFLDGVHKENNGEHPVFAQTLINNAAEYEKDYLPSIWKNVTKQEIDAGHGGMDALMFKVFADCAINNLPMPIDVYDAAVWMSVSCLSEQSILLGGAPQIIPDFTGGKWILRPSSDVTSLET